MTGRARPPGPVLRPAQVLPGFGETGRHLKLSMLTIGLSRGTRHLPKLQFLAAPGFRFARAVPKLHPLNIDQKLLIPGGERTHHGHRL